jgi:2-hydroxy-3-oxopropionate reductase
METVGYIGLGIMGRPAALNLVRAGYTVQVYARRAESMTPLIEAGATACGSPAEVAAKAEIVFTNVSDTPDVEQVILGKDGVVEGVRDGSVVVDMSTIAASVTREIAARLKERGADMLDAPVSGGEKGAIDGTLSIMVGGDEKIFERVKPLFEVMGKNIVLIGGNGAGQVAKACNQVVIAQAISAIGEAYLLARKSGVDPFKVRDALLGGFAGSKALESHGLRMLERNFAPGFKARLHHKDMRIVLDEAQKLGLSLPGAAMVTQYLNALMGGDMGEDDSISIYRLQERLNSMPAE